MKALEKRVKTCKLITLNYSRIVLLLSSVLSAGNIVLILALIHLSICFLYDSI